MAIPPISIDVTADTADAERGLDRVADKTKDLDGVSRKTGVATDRLSSSQTKLGKSSFFAGNRARMLTQQLSQVGQQTAATGQPIQALAVQAADIGMAFGVAGTIIGTVAGLALPALISALGGGKSAMESLSDSMDVAKDALDSYSAAVRLTRGNLEGLRAELGSTTSASLQYARALEDIAKGETQAAIDSLTSSLSDLFAVSGAGEARAGIADFFDVNIMLAFTRASRDARDEARGLTAEFAAAQEELAQSGDDIERQVPALQRLLSAAQKLAAANGDINEQERELIKNIASALGKAERFRVEVEQAEGASEGMREAILGAVRAADNLATGVGDFSGKLATAAKKAWDMAAGLLAANTEFAKMKAIGGGRGGDPRQFGFSETDLQLLRQSGTGVFNTTMPTTETGFTGGGGGGGGAGESLSGQLDAVREALATESELISLEFENQQLVLEEALAQRLITQQEFQELSLRAAQEHAAAMSGVEGGYQSDALSQAGTFFGDMASALGSGNDKMLNIAKKFAKAEAVINSIRAYTQVVADPTLPWFAKLPTALGIAAAVTSAASGLGGGSGGGSGPAATAQPQPQPLQVSLSGINPTDIFSGAQIMDFLFDGLQDKAQDRGVSFVR